MPATRKRKVSAVPLTVVPDELQDMRTIGKAELSAILGRSPKTIAIDLQRRPHTLPPLFKTRGGKEAHRWRIWDVRQWMEELAAEQAELRRDKIALARQQVFARAGWRRGR